MHMTDILLGFQAAGVPAIKADILSKYVGYLPVAIIVLLLEHIAVAKSFGRVNNYTINPSQEMVAIGMTNILGPFLGAFPTTGSFSRTAIRKLLLFFVRLPTSSFDYTIVPSTQVDHLSDFTPVHYC